MFSSQVFSADFSTNNQGKEFYTIFDVGDLVKEDVSSQWIKDIQSKYNGRFFYSHGQFHLCVGKESIEDIMQLYNLYSVDNSFTQLKKRIKGHKLKREIKTTP